MVRVIKWIRLFAWMLYALIGLVFTVLICISGKPATWEFCVSAWMILGGIALLMLEVALAPRFPRREITP